MAAITASNAAHRLAQGRRPVPHASKVVSMPERLVESPLPTRCWIWRFTCRIEAPYLHPTHCGTGVLRVYRIDRHTLDLSRAGPPKAQASGFNPVIYDPVPLGLTTPNSCGPSPASQKSCAAIRWAHSSAFGLAPAVHLQIRVVRRRFCTLRSAAGQTGYRQRNSQTAGVSKPVPALQRLLYSLLRGDSLGPLVRFRVGACGASANW
jgi:hypothetical protein